MLRRLVGGFSSPGILLSKYRNAFLKLGDGFASKNAPKGVSGVGILCKGSYFTGVHTVSGVLISSNSNEFLIVPFGVVNVPDVPDKSPSFEKCKLIT